MPTFKYTVANKEGKKLNGTIQAPSKDVAKVELNNLSFSLLALDEITEEIEIDKTLTMFVFEAIDKQSRQVTGTIPSKNEKEAFEKIRIEYELTVTAIWKKGATDEEIKTARTNGTATLQKKLQEKMELEKAQNTAQSLEEEKEKAFIKEKIDFILDKINKLLEEFGDSIDIGKRSEINKKIDKLLRIKQSTNYKYILSTAEEILIFIQNQEKSLKDKGLKDKQLSLNIKTKQLLSELHKTSQPKTVSEDILNRISEWRILHTKDIQTKLIAKILNGFFIKIENLLSTPPEIKELKDKIKTYNGQLWDFFLLYFKEPTPEYKKKVKKSISTIWATRKATIQKLKEVKKAIKMVKNPNKIQLTTPGAILKEANSFTGWVLFFYTIYYFIALYINTKNFGFSSIPTGFTIYQSQIFKYVFTITFIIHISIALKVNFFEKNKISSFIILPIAAFGCIISLLNF